MRIFELTAMDLSIKKYVFFRGIVSCVIILFGCLATHSLAQAQTAFTPIGTLQSGMDQTPIDPDELNMPNVTYLDPVPPQASTVDPKAALGNIDGGRAPSPECIAKAASTQGIPVQILLGIMKTEGGYYGSASANTNGSYDLGFMQINNQAWVPTLAKSIFGVDDRKSEQNTISLLMYDPCYNVNIGAYILHLYADEAGFDQSDARSWWGPKGMEAVGWYNSHSPGAMHKYQSEFVHSMNELFGRQLR